MTPGVSPWPRSTRTRRRSSVSLFHRLHLDEQATLVEAVRDADDWHGLAASHAWSIWTRYACAAFYSHPWAWNEIGCGGPAYPRGYQALWRRTNASNGRSLTDPTSTRSPGATASRPPATPMSASSAPVPTPDEPPIQRHHRPSPQRVRLVAALRSGPHQSPPARRHCADTPTRTCWTSSSLVAGRAAPPSSSVWPGRAGRRPPSMPDRSGIPTQTG